MIGRQKLVEYEQHGQALVEDGHMEGRMLLELLQEVKRLQAAEWSPESLRAGRIAGGPLGRTSPRQAACGSRWPRARATLGQCSRLR